MTAITITRQTEPLAILREMRRLLSDPERWTTGTFARGKSSRWVLTGSPAAVRWCIGGALTRCTAKGGDLDAVGDALTSGAMFDNLMTFNDAPTTTHADVIALLDTTIARLEQAS